MPIQSKHQRTLWPCQTSSLSTRENIGQYNEGYAGNWSAKGMFHTREAARRRIAEGSLPGIFEGGGRQPSPDNKLDVGGGR